MDSPSAAKPNGCGDTGDTRSRIIGATFNILMERGYVAATTNEIARRARVSKRELYALFHSKEDILAAMIAGRAARMRQPLTLPEAENYEQFKRTLMLFGANLLQEGTNPAVMAITRLSIAEAERAPELAHRLEEHGRKPTRAALAEFLRAAAARGLIDGDADAMAARYVALLWGDLQLALLLRLAEPPSANEIEQRAEAAAAALLVLDREPVSRA